MVDFNKGVFAAVAQHSAAFLYHPSLLAQRDELPRSALHRVIVCGLRRGEVTDQSNQLLDVMVGIVPKLNAEWKILVAPRHKSI